MKARGKAPVKAVAALAAAAFASAPAAAHDTWFERLPEAVAGGVELALGTGNRFPRMEDPVGHRHVVKSGCLDTQHADRPLVLLRHARRSTRLRAEGVAPPAFSCWMQLEAFDVELDAARVQVYFDEARPPPAVVAAWQAIAARGEPFRERYVKGARIDGAATPARGPVLDLDLLRRVPAGPWRAGVEGRVEVQRDGRPLPGLAVELVSADRRVATWLRSDAGGGVLLRPPAPGRWLLRAVDLRAPAAPGARFESRFVTLAFDVMP